MSVLVSKIFQEVSIAGVSDNIMGKSDLNGKLLVRIIN